MEGEDFEDRFHRLAAEWRKECGPHSSAQRMAGLRPYREIVAMGAEVVPVMLRELRRTPDHWFIALHELTGASPVPSEHAGNIVEMALAWVSWGESTGLIKPAEVEAAELTADWKKETQFLSDVGRILKHKSYERLVRIGRRAVPFLFRQLEAEGDTLYAGAIRRILRDGPTIPNVEVGNSARVRDVWLAWGRERGFC